MIGTKYERHISLLELWASKNPQGPAQVGLLSLLKVLENAHRSQRAVGWVTDRGVTVNSQDVNDPYDVIYIADMAVTEDRVSILINRGLPGESPPAWLNIRLQKITPALPEDAESVQAKSAHLVISTRPHSDGRRSVHRAGFERVEGISRNLAFALLTEILRRHASENPGDFVHERREPKTGRILEAPFQPGIGVAAHPSESLKKDIEEGRVVGVELLRSVPKYAGPDVDDIVQDIESKITVSIKSTTDEAAIFRAVNYVIEKIGGSGTTRSVRIILESDRGKCRPRTS